jgi:predicted ferric reductase
MSVTVSPEPLWDQPPAPRQPRPQAAPHLPQPLPARRLPAAGRSWVVTALAILAGLGLGITLALGISAESAGSLRAPGGLLTAGGRLAGLAAGYSMVVVVVLVARLAPLERAIGQDRLVRWHRKLGPWPLYLLVAHASLITVGYARAAHDGVLHQLGQLLWTYPGILAASVGGVLLIAAGVTSYKKARARMAYETWWSVHLYTYLALFLSFSHQIHTGASFVGHRLATDYWTALWIGTLALVLVSRVGLPIWRSTRHRLTVVRVIPESPNTFSVVMRGRRLDRLPIAGGQFLQWRFLKRGLWWQAHPYSLSAAPRGDKLRITVKVFGDHSAALARLRPGTRVAIEGPYGVFTADARHTDRVLLVGAGVGITPVRALLQELPSDVAVDVILRGSAPEDLVLQREIAAARRAGVPASHLHHESFAL